MLDLYTELRKVTQALEVAELRYCLVGGLAVAIYARPRATEDMDLLLDAGDVEKAVAALAQLGYLDLAAPMRVADMKIEIRRLVRVQGEQHAVLDLLLASEPDLRGMLARRIRSEFNGQGIWVVPLDGLCALKKLRSSPQDLADLDALRQSAKGSE